MLSAALLAGVAFWLNAKIEKTIKQQMAEDLRQILKSDVDALQLWLKSQVGEAYTLSLDPNIIRLTQTLVSESKSAKNRSEELSKSKALMELRTYLEPRLKALDFDDFFVVDSDFRVVGSNSVKALGANLTSYRREFFDDVMKEHQESLGKVSTPFPAVLALKDRDGVEKSGLPTMLTASPLKEKGEPFGIISFRIQPEHAFTKILGLAKFGETGETYAFNRKGLLLSQSRYDQQLKKVGLLKETERSILNLEIRDPGVDLTAGGIASQDRKEQPLTRMAAECVEGKPGFDVNGYRDYRGVKVIGAWTWIDEFDFGVATEANSSEAFQTLIILKITFWILFCLLVVTAISLLILMLLLQRRQAALRKATIEMKLLGQYQLDEKIGAGGMGSVYRAHHQLMRRPTAVKLLDGDKISDLAIIRFEREVQQTSRLNHPNTIAIYDFGRTPEGIFYYAMEYLEGLDLNDLVDQYGPVREERVIFILLQVCASLAEAHRLGLIHRDIKPANIMLTDRGGWADFVKVLDFGLVKSAEDDQTGRLSSPQGFIGTPLYLSPEGIQTPNQVDLRTDLYALGAVGYFMLTGTPPFPGSNAVDICTKHVRDPLEPISKRLGREVHPDLAEILERALSKNPDQRPASAEVMTELLTRCQAFGKWTSHQAESWWVQWRESLAAKKKEKA